jgi:hypothetical protein
MIKTVAAHHAQARRWNVQQQPTHEVVEAKAHHPLPSGSGRLSRNAIGKRRLVGL